MKCRPGLSVVAAMRDSRYSCVPVWGVVDYADAPAGACGAAEAWTESGIGGPGCGADGAASGYR